MAGKSYGKSETFGQRARKYLRRFALCAAFAGAAAGTGYHYYGTTEEITARVDKVEVTMGPGGEAISTVIHTDRGTFANDKTLAWWKNAKDVQDLNALTRPGTTVKLKVYGYGGVAGVKFEYWGIYRNVVSAAPIDGNTERLTDPSQVSPPGSPDSKLPADIPLPIPANLQSPEAKDLEDPLLGEACVDNANLQELAEKAPRLARDLAVMRQLPLTGRPVYDMVRDPANGIHSCLFPVPPKSGSTSTYQDKKARIARASGTSTSFHEYFHAWQDKQEGRNDMFTLTQKDSIAANLLKEASAVAYELASRQEAENRGLRFYDTPDVVETREQGGVRYTTTYTETSPAKNIENRKAFKEAYDAAFAASAGLDAQAREAKALEAKAAS
jgi:hypothetical protein